MGRPSNRQRRRTEIVEAFARELSRHGYAGATITQVAAEADLTPGLLHHHFRNKQEMLDELLEHLLTRFRDRVRQREVSRDPMDAFVQAALALDEKADVVEARCWVGVLAEAVRQPHLFARVRRLIDAEVQAIVRRSGNTLSPQNASAVLAFVLGALVFGAFAPQKASGFAAPSLTALIDALRGAGP